MKIYLRDTFVVLSMLFIWGIGGAIFMIGALFNHFVIVPIAGLIELIRRIF